MTTLRTLTLADIACYLPYGLKGYHPEGHVCNITIESYAKYGMANYLPQLRPMQDLYREIDGKVGIVELAKIHNPNLKWEFCSNNSAICNRLQRFWWYGSGFNCAPLDNKGWILVDNQVAIFDYLNQHMYDYRGLIEVGLAVNINSLEDEK